MTFALDDFGTGYTQQQLDALDAELADAGPIKAWKIARARRRAAQAGFS